MKQRNMHKIVLLVLLLGFFVFGCIQSDTSTTSGTEPPPPSSSRSTNSRVADPGTNGINVPTSPPEMPMAEYEEFIGRWRNYSNYLDWHFLELYADGTWSLGVASGTWRVDDITDEDWERWGIEPYGPTRKIVFEGWSEGIVDGPVEESTNRVDFFWVIYDVEWPVPGSWAQAQIKYGHVNEDL